MSMTDWEYMIHVKATMPTANTEKFGQALTQNAMANDGSLVITYCGLIYKAEGPVETSINKLNCNQTEYTFHGRFVSCGSAQEPLDILACCSTQAESNGSYTIDTIPVAKDTCDVDADSAENTTKPENTTKIEETAKL